MNEFAKRPEDEAWVAAKWGEKYGVKVRSCVFVCVRAQAATKQQEGGVLGVAVLWNSGRWMGGSV
jgi:hypothetical protein